jgi:hypothetical protein
MGDLLICLAQVTGCHPGRLKYRELPRPGLASSANEIRRMLTALCGPLPDEQHARRWSRWRHRHQERARRCHYQRQQLQDH